MTNNQFDALAALMRLRPSPSREALRLVLVDGATHTAAAERAGIPRPNVTRQVSSARHALALIEAITDKPASK
ncbi:hypothetical protein [Alcaligenes sp. SDU_A2]|uniref:hypothetical protein n=1 Tax=Alcaligenes sp. SDU_A2 TaxID=3136634 RepID=UPI00311ECCB3